MPRRADRSSELLSILLLCDDRPSHAPNVLEHIRAFRRYSRHDVDVFNPRGITRSRFLRLTDYDVVVVHYTIVPYLSEWFREQISRFGGLKVEFMQDEYRQVDALTASIRQLGIHLLFSSVPAESVTSVYGSRLPDVEILPTLTGYVPADLEGHSPRSLEGRRLDVVYRGRSVPYWLGRLGQDKNLIGREFLARAPTDLRCDISWTEADRIYGEAWYRFLGSSRTTLGTESGASIVDFDGSLQERTESFLRERPAATFDEVEGEILAPFEGNAVIQAVSPRVFEAAALGTAMINFPGRYSGVIEPWVHYIPLEKDFSNFDDVVSALRDDGVLDPLVSRAHADLVSSGRYSLKTFMARFDGEIEARLPSSERRPQSRVVRQLNRRFLGLEHLRSPKRIAEIPAVDSLRKQAAERTARDLIRRFPEIEALASQADREGSEVRVERLQHDLVRLAAAAAAHLRELRYLGPPFDVQLVLGDDNRRLMLVGIPEPPPIAAQPEQLRDRVTSAIREGRLDEIVWDNSAVRDSLKFLSIPIPSLEIGYHVIGGAHRFTALMELAGRDPDSVIEALDPFFRSRPASPVHELDRRAVMLLQIVPRPQKRSAPGGS